jgi:hypothetical protein
VYLFFSYLSTGELKQPLSKQCKEIRRWNELRRNTAWDKDTVIGNTLQKKIIVLTIGMSYVSMHCF